MKRRRRRVEADVGGDDTLSKRPPEPIWIGDVLNVASRLEVLQRAEPPGSCLRDGVIDAWRGRRHVLLAPGASVRKVTGRMVGWGMGTPVTLVLSHHPGPVPERERAALEQRLRARVFRRRC